MKRLFLNCKIITMDSSNPYGVSMIVDDGRILDVFYEPLKETNTLGCEIVDLKGAYIIPGFWESHLHIATGMRSLMELNLRDCCNSKQLKERVHNYSKKVVSEDWVIGHGWDEKKIFDGKFPDKYLLDELCDNHPMVFIRMDGHSLCVNTKAIESLGLQDIEHSVEAPQGTDGKPTGMFYENTASEILASIECLLPDNYIEKVILNAQELFLKNGITSVNDISIQYGRYLELYRKLGAEGKLKIRITASPNGADEDLVDDFERNKTNQNERLRIGPPKYFMDGSFGSRTGLLWEEYTDDPGNSGLQLIEEEELEEIISANAAKGRPVNIHAIGDKAVSIILDTFDKLKCNNMKKLRSRIEHIQIIKDNDIERFKNNSVTASFQPVFLYEVDLTNRRLGNERISRVYRMNSFIEQGVNVIFNSDWPYGGEEFPSKPDGTNYIGFEPLLGIHAACCKQMNENEAVNPKQALTCYTVNPAYVNYSEKELGSLKKGYLADFVVLSKDIVNISPNDIINAEVLAVYISGEKVYAKKNP